MASKASISKPEISASLAMASKCKIALVEAAVAESAMAAFMRDCCVREAEEGHRHRHRIGRELAAARTCAGTGGFFDVFEFFVVNNTSCASANGFEDVLNGEVFAFVVPRHDRAAIKHDARNIHPSEGHACCWDGFIASHQYNDAVEAVTFHGEFNGITNHFAGHKRGAHAFASHGDTVGNCDGVKINRRSACGANTRADWYG